MADREKKRGRYKKIEYKKIQKIQKIEFIPWERKELFRWNIKHFSVFEWLSLGKK